MTKEFGAKTAQGFGDRHEQVKDQPEAEKVVDLHNNAKGREWAQLPGVDIKARCQAGINTELRLVIPFRP